jgi:hypothetical protein
LFGLLVQDLATLNESQVVFGRRLYQGWFIESISLLFASLDNFRDPVHWKIDPAWEQLRVFRMVQVRDVVSVYVHLPLSKLDLLPSEINS